MQLPLLGCAQPSASGLWVGTRPGQHCPQLPGVLVGDGDQGLVVADPSAQHDDPLLQTRQLFRDSRRCFRRVAAKTLRAPAQAGVRKVVPSPRDPTKFASCPAARLTGRETELRRKLASVPEHRCVAHAGGHGVSRDESDAGRSCARFASGSLRLLGRDLPVALPIRASSASSWSRTLWINPRRAGDKVVSNLPCQKRTQCFGPGSTINPELGEQTLGHG